MIRRLAIVCVWGLACSSGDKERVASDSGLARDLALVGSLAQAAPELRDTALSATTAPATSRRDAVPKSERAAQPVVVPSPPPTVPVPVPVPVPSAPAFHGISKGTSFSLTTKSPMCTTNLPGDKITATITETVVDESGATIPAGTVVVLEVVDVTPGDKPESARLGFRIRSILITDEPVSVAADVAVVSDLERHKMPRDNSGDRRKIVGGAIAGAVIGQIMGKDTKSTVAGAAVGAAAGAAAAAASGARYDACLPAGGTLRATTTEPLTIAANGSMSS